MRGPHSGRAAPCHYLRVSRRRVWATPPRPWVLFCSLFPKRWLTQPKTIPSWGYQHGPVIEVTSKWTSALSFTLLFLAIWLSQRSHADTSLPNRLCVGTSVQNCAYVMETRGLMGVGVASCYFNARPAISKLRQLYRPISSKLRLNLWSSVKCSKLMAMRDVGKAEAVSHVGRAY